MDLREEIQQRLQAFQKGNLRENAIALLGTLGYKSEKTIDLDGSPKAFLEQFDTISKACREHGADFPTFESDPTGMMVEFEGHVPEEQVTVEGLAENTGKTTQETAGKSRTHVGETLGKTRVETLGKTRVEMRVKTPERILDQFRINPEFALADVAKVIGKSTSTVERACSKLVQQGRLKHFGPRKGGYWEVLEKNS